LTSPHLQPIHDLAATIVYSGRASNVSTTIVKCWVLMRDGVLLTRDLPSLYAMLDRDSVRSPITSPGGRLQDYDA